jgi:type II secretory pathway pseudopilin PulG
VTLSELLVSMLVMSIVMAMAVSSAVAGLRTTRDIQVRTKAVAEVQQAVQRSARHLRAVYPLVRADASSFSANEVRGTTTYFVTVDISPTVGVNVMRYREWLCSAPPCLVTPATAAVRTDVWSRGLLAPTTPGTNGNWFQYSWIDDTGAVVSGPIPPTSTLARVFSARIALRRAVPKLSPVESGTVVAVRNSSASTG